MADAGLTKDDVDGFASTGLGVLAPVELAEYLGLRPGFIDSTGVGRGGVGVHAGARGRRHRPRPGRGRAARPTARRPAPTSSASCAPPTCRSAAGGRCSSTCRTGTRSSPSTRWPPAGTCTSSGRRSSSWREIAVSARANASLNPDAYYRDPITIDDVLDSPMIADPFTTLHCCIRSDGGGAVVLAAEDRARDCANRLCGCSARARRCRHTTMSEWADFTDSPARRSGAARVRAGGRDAGRHRRVRAVRRVHVDGAAHARGARVLRQGRSGPVRRGRPLARSVARCPPTPTAAGCRTATRGCGGCSCWSRRYGSFGPRRGDRQVAGRPAGVRQRHRRVVLAPRRRRSSASSELRPGRRRTRGARGRRACRAMARRRTPTSRHVVKYMSRSTIASSAAAASSGSGRWAASASHEALDERAGDVGERVEAERDERAVGHLVLHPRPDHRAVALVRRRGSGPATPRTSA